MAVDAGATPRPTFLAEHWVESSDRPIDENTVRPSEPAGCTFYATAAQYEAAVEAAVAAFDVIRGTRSARSRSAGSSLTTCYAIEDMTETRFMVLAQPN